MTPHRSGWQSPCSPDGTSSQRTSPYQELLHSGRVRRIYLNEYPMPADPPLGMGILQLVSAPVSQAKELVARLFRKAENEIADIEMGAKVVELVEELLMRRFPKLNRGEIRAMFQLEDLRKTRVWQEALEEGLEQGLEQGLERGLEQGRTLEKKRLVRKWLDKGMATKEIAALLEISVPEVRRLAKDRAS
jgi:predicted transposase/invertase (TIGR01784 family)